MSDNDEALSPPQFEPQLKKARYLWQIKGKSSQSQEDNSRPCCSREEPSTEVDTAHQDAEEEEPPCRMVIAWRAQHLAKALFDNTINTMIENMSIPLADMDHVMDGYSNHRSNNNLEDQAVRMAIRSHGLHKTCSCIRQRPTPHVPCYIPFHHRTDYSLFGGPSTSSTPARQMDSMEQDILSEAVNVAILNKGLGASHGSI
ncbi:Hypothetical protein NTJ_07838 [Nesidiocoris tenuis]|uniref:Uncharacterized protein n=1 Tax=Nesidiocoris tenuis TaxID=355587 RepID=A0ABN7AS52_9HEMI|nr:Hypothetical protein NTJ_07838 [Nesidiocoris tenuis]